MPETTLPQGHRELSARHVPVAATVISVAHTGGWYKRRKHGKMKQSYEGRLISNAHSEIFGKETMYLNKRK